MEDQDRSLVKNLMKNDMRLRRLYKQHQALEEKLSRFAHKRFLTVNEEIEQKNLKKKKLSGVDEMLAITREHRAA